MPTTFTDAVFSEYELLELAMKFNDEEEGTFTHADCTGSWEEEADTLTVTKNCRGTVAKKRTRGVGSGTITYSGHMPHSLWVKMYNMDQEGLAEGVAAYGKNSRHREMTVVAKLLDEDGNIKYKAYPRVVANNLNRSVENGSEEVAETEIELGWMPDDNGNGFYEALEADMGTDTSGLKTKWMTAWTPDLMLASA